MRNALRQEGVDGKRKAFFLVLFPLSSCSYAGVSLKLLSPVPRVGSECSMSYHKGRHPQYGVIDFAVETPVSQDFKSAVLQVPEKEWHPLFRTVKGEPIRTGHEWAEVCFVPNWAGSSKEGPDYRFIAIREPLRQLELPGMSEQLEFPFPTAFFKGNMRYKLHGIVTNRTTQPGDEVIFWYWARCGKSEEVHAVMKEDLAGGKLPSDSFGVNAAWWAIILRRASLMAPLKNFNGH